MKYRKRPVVIEAIQFTNPFEVMQWAENFGAEIRWEVSSTNIGIPTLEGKMIASRHDWIIRGVHGEFYPCKPDIFEKTYEKVEE